MNGCRCSQWLSRKARDHKVANRPFISVGTRSLNKLWNEKYLLGNSHVYFNLKNIMFFVFSISVLHRILCSGSADSVSMVGERGDSFSRRKLHNFLWEKCASVLVLVGKEKHTSNYPVHCLPNQHLYFTKDINEVFCTCHNTELHIWTKEITKCVESRFS